MSKDKRRLNYILTHGAHSTADNPSGMRQPYFNNPYAGRQHLINEIGNNARSLIVNPGGWQARKSPGPTPSDPSVRMGGAQRKSIERKYLEMYDEGIHDGLRANPSATVGLYMSSKIVSPHSVNMDGWRWTNPFNSKDYWAMMSQCMQPWVRAGVSEIFLDNASHTNGREGALAYANHYQTRGVRIGIEGLPVDRKVGRWDINEDMMNQVPALALLRFVRHRDPNQEWDVHGLENEAIIIIHISKSAPEPALDELVNLLDRGFVLGSAGKWDDLVTEAYDVHSGAEEEVSDRE